MYTKSVHFIKIYEKLIVKKLQNNQVSLYDLAKM